jgi:hypothetical protein
MISSISRWNLSMKTDMLLKGYEGVHPLENHAILTDGIPNTLLYYKFRIKNGVYSTTSPLRHTMDIAPELYIAYKESL